jgi:DNA polymerase III epsilon subunit-like protein
MLDPLNGDRIVEIGAVELINRSPTGQKFQRYLCPLGSDCLCKDVERAAYR